jgi:hypothetical protein
MIPSFAIRMLMNILVTDRLTATSFGSTVISLVGLVLNHAKSLNVARNVRME